MTFLLSLITFTIILKSEIHPLIFESPNFDIKNENFTDIIHSILKSVSNFCIITHVSFSEVLDVILIKEYVSNNNKYIYTDNNTIPSNCDCFMVLEIPSQTVCSMFSKYKKKYLTLWKYVLILSTLMGNDLDQLNHCSSVFGSANVLIISLQTNNMSMLSSSLLPPRHFVSVNHEKCILPSLNSIPSLQGTTIKVVTFNYPPFSVIRELNNSSK